MDSSESTQITHRNGTAMVLVFALIRFERRLQQQLQRSCSPLAHDVVVDHLAVSNDPIHLQLDESTLRRCASFLLPFPVAPHQSGLKTMAVVPRRLCSSSYDQNEGRHSHQQLSARFFCPPPVLPQTSSLPPPPVVPAVVTLSACSVVPCVQLVLVSNAAANDDANPTTQQQRLFDVMVDGDVDHRRSVSARRIQSQRRSLTESFAVAVRRDQFVESTLDAERRGDVTSSAPRHLSMMSVARAPLRQHPHEEEHVLHLVTMLLAQPQQQHMSTELTFVCQSLFRRVHLRSAATTATTSSVGPLIPQLLRQLVVSPELNEHQKRRRMGVIVRAVLRGHVQANVHGACPCVRVHSNDHQSEQHGSDGAPRVNGVLTCARPLVLQASNPLRQSLEGIQRHLGVCTCWLSSLLVLPSPSSTSPDSSIVCDTRGGGGGGVRRSPFSATAATAATSTVSVSLIEAALSAQSATFLEVISRELDTLRCDLEHDIGTHRLFISSLQMAKPSTGAEAAMAPSAASVLVRRIAAMASLETTLAAMMFEVSATSSTRPVFAAVSATTMTTCARPTEVSTDIISNDFGGHCAAPRRSPVSQRKLRRSRLSQELSSAMTPITRAFAEFLEVCGAPHVMIAAEDLITSTARQGGRVPIHGRATEDIANANHAAIIEYYMHSTTASTDAFAATRTQSARQQHLSQRHYDIRQAFLQAVFLDINAHPFHTAYPAPLVAIPVDNSLALPSERRIRWSATAEPSAPSPVMAFPLVAAAEGGGGGGHLLRPAAAAAAAASSTASNPLHLAALRGNASFVRLFVHAAITWSTSLDDHNRRAKHLLPPSSSSTTRQRVGRRAPRNAQQEQLHRVLNAPNNFGATPLWLAASKGHADACRILLDNGARANTSTGSEMSALHVALISGHRAVVAVLLMFGADVTPRLMLTAQRLDDAAATSSSSTSRPRDEHNAGSLPRLEDTDERHPHSLSSALSHQPLPPWTTLLAEAQELHTITGGGGDANDDMDRPDASDPPLLPLEVDDEQNAEDGPQRIGVAAGRGGATASSGSPEWVAVFGAWGMTAYVGMLLVALVARVLLS